MASRDEKISKLEDQIKFKKDSLKKLPGQAQIKNAQIALLGREAANPSTSSEDPKNINIDTIFQIVENNNYSIPISLKYDQ